MKILHLLYESKGDFHGIGGVGMRAYKIYNLLKARHEITLLCKKYPGARDGIIDGLHHCFVGIESCNRDRTLLAYACSAARFVRKHGTDYDVIVEDFSPAIPTCLGFYKKRPVVLQLQGYTGKHYFEKYNLLYAAVLFMFEKCSPLFYRYHIVVSENTGRRYGLERENRTIAVISNGIDADILKYNPHPLDYILYMGRIDVHIKGIDTLIEAYSQFMKDYPNIKLVIAGDGRENVKLNRILDDLPESVRRNIDLAGWVDGERKSDLFRGALMVVVPSRYETQNIVALEALGYGKPVIVSDLPELSYVVSSGAGECFKTDDHHSLSKRMREFMSSDDLISRGLRGRDWVRMNTWEKNAALLEKFLHSIT